MPPHPTRYNPRPPSVPIQLTVAPILPPLLDALVERLRAPLPSPFAVEHVVVPGAAMSEWLAASLSEQLGVWCNHAVYTPAQMLERLGGERVQAPSAWQIRDALLRRLGTPGFEAPARYLGGDDTGIRSIQLSVRVAALFASYCRYRPERIARWTAAPTGALEDGGWQAVLWRDVSGGVDPLATVAGIVGHPSGLPSRLSVYAVDHLAPLELALLRSLNQHIDVSVFALSHTPLAAALREEATVRSLVVEPAVAADRSVRVHATHGPMREVEVLRDQLLTLFAADPTIQPEDVLVLAPDINDYAALIKGIFGSEADISKVQGARARIPVCFADRSPVVESPGLAAMKTLLSLPHSRRPLSVVRDLLSIAPVHARFDLSEEDATVARDWLDAAAVRWGEDGAFRARFHNPTLPQHTWRWGLDRLLLGYAIEGEGSRLYADILPIDGIEGNNALPLGGLCGYCAALFEHLARLEGVYTPTDWVAVLLGAYDALVSTRGTWASSRLTLVRALGELSGDKPVAIGAVADWLDGHLEQVAREEHFYTGGVSCASLRAGRVVPVRVVALLGLDYDRFPRDPTPLAFDLCAADPHPGDLPARSEDRLVFRSAVLAAADHLHLSYTGHGSRDNKERPPSVLISELLDSLSPSVRLATTVFHPMQPFSPRAFEDARTPNYSISLHGGAVALLADTQKEPPFFPVPLAADPASLVVDLNVLIRFFQNPVATVLKRRLELNFEQDADPPSDTEPFSLSSLEDWKVGDKLVRAMLVGADAEQLWPAMRESGLLPMGTPGRIKYEGLAGTASVIVAAALACGAGDARPNVDLDIVLPALSGDPVPGRVTGRLDGRRLGGGLTVTYSKLDAKRLLAAWTRHLAAQSAGLQPAAMWAVGRDKPGKPDIRAWQATPDPTRWLQQLMMLHAEGMTRPLPFMPKSSFAYAVKYLALRSKGTAELERRRESGNAAYGAWLPSSMGIGKEIPGEGDDPAVARVYDSAVLWTDEFHTLALRVFAPMQGEYSLPESSL